MKEIFKTKNVRNLFIGQMISSVGDWFNFIAVTILVYELTGSALSIVLTIIAKRAPAIFSSFFSGYLADRVRNKAILLWANFLSSFAVLPLLLVTDVSRVWIIYATYSVLSVLSMCNQISQRTIIRKLVSKEHHLQVNSLMHSASLVVMTFSASLGAYVLQFVGYQGLFALDALTFFVATGFIYRIKIIEEKPKISEHTFLKELLRGAEEIFLNPQLTRWFWYIVLTSITYCSIGIIVTTYPLSIFGMGKPGVGYFNSLYGIATLIATIVTVKFTSVNLGGFMKIRALIVALSGFFLLMLASATHAAAGLSFFLLSTTLYMMFELFQENVLFKYSPPHLLGRTTAFYKVAMLIIFTLANLAYGKVAELFTLRHIGWIAGSLMILGPILLESIFLFGRIRVAWMRRAFTVLVIVFMSCAIVGAYRLAVHTEVEAVTVEKKKDFTLKIHMVTYPSTLDPAKALDRESLILAHQLYDTLLSHAENGTLEASIAQTWHISDDGLRYRFKIRSDITFHNGRLLSAHDVKYSLDRARSDQKEMKLSGYLKAIQEIRVDDDDVILILKHPYTPLLKVLSAPTLSIIPKFESLADESFFDHPIGTGPYRWDRNNSDEKILHLTRFEDYFKGKPNPKAISVQLMSEDEGFLAFLNEDLDFFNTNQAKYINAFKKQELKLIQTKRHGIGFLAINHNHPHLNDPDFRRMLYHALDRGVYEETVLSSGQTAAYQFLSRDLSGRIPEEHLTLKKPGKVANKGGVTLELIKYEKFRDPAEDKFFRDSFSRYGVDLKIRYVNRKDYLHRHLFKKNFTLLHARIYPEVMDPGTILSEYESDSAANFFNYKNPTFDRALFRAQQTPDVYEAQELYAKASKILYHDVAVIPLFFTDSYVAVRKGIHFKTPSYVTEFSELLHLMDEEHL